MNKKTINKVWCVCIFKDYLAVTCSLESMVSIICTQYEDSVISICITRWSHCYINYHCY